MILKIRPTPDDYEKYSSSDFRLKARKITANDFKTNRDMLDKDILRYCENFASYLYHIKHFFSEDFNKSEIAWLNFLKVRIKCFLKDSPHSDLTCKFESRYQRVLTRLNKLYNGPKTCK